MGQQFWLAGLPLLYGCCRPCFCGFIHHFVDNNSKTGHKILCRYQDIERYFNLGHLVYHMKLVRQVTLTAESTESAPMQHNNHWSHRHLMLSRFTACALIGGQHLTNMPYTESSCWQTSVDRWHALLWSACNGSGVVWRRSPTPCMAGVDDGGSVVGVAGMTKYITGLSGLTGAIVDITGR